MKEKLSIQELKALCEFFFNAGYNRRHTLNTSPAGREARGETWEKDFKDTFDELMLGKYNKSIEQQSFQLQWDEMQTAIQNEMDNWDIEQRGKAAQAIEDMRKIIITA